MMRAFAALLLASAAIVHLHAASHGDHANEAYLQLKKTNDAYAAIEKGSLAWNKKILLERDQNIRVLLETNDTLELSAKGESRISHKTPHASFGLLDVIHIKNGSDIWMASPDFGEYVEAESAQVSAGIAAYAVNDEHSGFHTDNFPEDPHAFDTIAKLELRPNETLELNGTEQEYKTLKIELKEGAHDAAKEKVFQEEYGGLGLVQGFLAIDLFELDLFRVKAAQPPMEATLWIDPETNLIVKQSFDVVVSTGNDELTLRYEILQTEALLDDEPPKERFEMDSSWNAVEAIGSRKPTIGEPAIDFTHTDLDGEEVTLSDLKGNVVVIDFWATWCPPCVAAMPHLQALYDQYKDDGLLVYGINREDDLKKPADFIANNGLTFPTLINANAAFLRYHVQGIPSTYVIDREGNINAHIPGFSEGDDRLQKALEKVFASTDEAPTETSEAPTESE